MKKELTIIVAYDIINDKRRRKIANVMEDYGDRIQYSVFECNLPQSRFEQMKQEISLAIEPKEDKVSFYFLCDACVTKKEYLGTCEIVQEPEVYII
ncbi:MAG: CRISPR-associated endonuclease Cas2 [bacterium]|nr:CRISPR-associated endonuclease Cas2 [bacterium]